MFKVFPDILQTIRHLGGIQILFCTLHRATLECAPRLGVVYPGDQRDNTFFLSSARVEGSAEFAECITEQVGSNDSASDLSLGGGQFEFWPRS